MLFQQSCQNVGEFRGSDLHIWKDPPTFQHFTPIARGKGLQGRIGHRMNFALAISVAVIQRVAAHLSPARRVSRRTSRRRAPARRRQTLVIENHIRLNCFGIQNLTGNAATICRGVIIANPLNHRQLSC